MPEMTDSQARQVVARAWKDEEFRKSLPSELREKLPPPPDGASEMSDEQLEAAAGGIAPVVIAGGVALAAGGAGYAFSEITD